MLVLAQKKFNKESYLLFKKQTKDLKSTSDENLKSLFDKFEIKMEYLGLVAIEDRLQDQVPQTINHI